MAGRRATLLGLLLALQACDARQAEPRPPPVPPAAPDAAPAPLAPLELTAPQPAPPARPARGCVLELRARAHALRGGRFQIDVALHNTSAEPVQLSYPDRCPLGPVSLAGLGAGYDFYQGCNKGACPGPRASLHSALAPGASETLVSLELDPRGGSCQPRLAPGRRELVASLPGATPAVCPSAPLPIQIGASPQAVPIALGGDAYRCERAEDCVLSCPEARGCCGQPCGCRHAIRRDHRAAYEADYARSCDKPPCPAAACAYRPAATAVCRDGRCQASSEPGF